MNIIALPILLIILISIILWITKVLRPEVNRLITWKNNLILAIGYIALLILAVPISNFLPTQDFIQQEEDKAGTMQTSPKYSNDLFAYPFPSEGKFDELPEVYKNSSQKFKLDTNVLSFSGSLQTEYNQIFIERVDSQSEEIEVDTYLAPHFIDEIDFTWKVLPPQISLKNGILFIQVPNRQNLEFRRFKLDFTINQFKQVKSNPSGMSSAHFGWKAVYLRVPKNLEIRDTMGYNIHWIDTSIKTLSAN